MVVEEGLEDECKHENVHIDRACCPAGTTDCGCFGRDGLVCENPKCSGIEDYQIEELWERADG